MQPNQHPSEYTATEALQKEEIGFDNEFFTSIRREKSTDNVDHDSDHGDHSSYTWGLGSTIARSFDNLSRRFSSFKAREIPPETQSFHDPPKMPVVTNRPPPISTSRTMLPEEIEATKLANREENRRMKIVGLQPVEDSFIDNKQIGRQWANAVTEVDNVFGGICVSVLLPHAAVIKIKTKAKRGRCRLCIHVVRHVTMSDWYATDENSQYIADVVLDGMDNIADEHVTYVYDNDYGVLFAYVDHVKSVIEAQPKNEIPVDGPSSASRPSSLRSPKSLPKNRRKPSGFFTSLSSMFADA